MDPGIVQGLRQELQNMGLSFSENLHLKMKRLRKPTGCLSSRNSMGSEC